MGIAAIALVGGLLTVGASAGSAAEEVTSVPGAVPPVGAAISAAAKSADTPAVGIIVKRSGARATLKAAATTVETSLRGISVTGSAGLMAGMDVINFDGAVSGAAALEAAAAVAALPGVEWAEPNYLRYRPATTPVFPTDPLWGVQWDMWDSARANGGYSIKAPYAWATTTGSPSVVVAVLDTGITSHPDLDANVVAGYDFVTNPLRGNDNDPIGSTNSRDADPGDPGDWVTYSESISGPYEGCYPGDSSWHGTHVAGTIAAIADNGIGLTGVAPTVRIQPVRVLGKCGGTVADSVAGITWASGGSVPGVPANPTPADVLNMSLGGAGSCLASEQAAINGALSRGASVIVAAGNAGEPVSNASPANCSGVVRVGSTTRSGGLSFFSNYGVTGIPLTISAPGGDGSPFTDSADIPSTYNSGTTIPGSPDYAPLAGTSMATPHVAGAAALLYSAGVTSPTQVTARLQAAVQPLSSSCSTTRCGAGILDLSRLFSNDPPPDPPDPPDPGEIGAPTDVSWEYAGEGSIDIYWTAPEVPVDSAIDYYVFETSDDDMVSWTPLAGTLDGGYTGVNIYDISLTGRHYFRFAAVLIDGRQGPWSSVVGPVTFESQIEVPGQIDIDTVEVDLRRTGRRYVATVVWAEPSGQVDGYEARLRRAKRPWGQWTELSGPGLQATRLSRRTTYRLQILAVNEAGSGPVLTIRFRTPRR